MKDTSLFISMLDYGVANLILSGDLGTGKGAIYENIVAYAFSKNGRKLYYYKENTGLEIEFITYYNNEINLVEVKAVSGNVKSSRQLLDDNIHYPNINGCIKLSAQNIG